MSYILDALKRADAERERGAAPGLHTRHQVPAGSPGTPSTTRNMGLALAAGMALLMLALFFWVARAPEQPNAAPSAPPALAAPNTTAPAAPVIAAVPPAAITPMAAPPAVLAEAPKVQALPVPAAPASRAVAAPTPSSGKPDKAATAAPAAKPLSQAAAPAPAAVPLLAELPQDMRSQIPKITITGSVYSDSPAQRLLLINNLVLPQGSLVGPDLTLEEIQPRSSVFSFKGTRFRVMH